MSLADTKKFFLDFCTEVGVPEVDIGVGPRLTHFFKITDRFYENYKGRLCEQGLEFFESIRDPEMYFYAIHVNAEQRLKDLSLDEELWKELEPVFRNGYVEFSATEKAKKELGSRAEAIDDKWTAWEAAELASATHHAPSIHDPRSAFFLGEFVGALICPRQRLELRELQKAVMKEIAHRRRPNAKGKARSPLKQLVLRMKEAHKNLTAQMVIDEFKKYANGIPALKIEDALAKSPRINIEIQEVTDASIWREGVIYFSANGREQSVQFKKIRDWLTGHRQRGINFQTNQTPSSTVQVVPLNR
ncbi:MAG: hypothetical protein P4M08_02560 [Oligoflexia bacterium]|nr:hypothetical protein [Oligoflexia bacterium]